MIDLRDDTTATSLVIGWIALLGFLFFGRCDYNSRQEYEVCATKAAEVGMVCVPGNMDSASKVVSPEGVRQMEEATRKAYLKEKGIE